MRWQRQSWDNGSWSEQRPLNRNDIYCLATHAMLLYCPLLVLINPCNTRFAELAKDDNNIAEALLIAQVVLKAHGRPVCRYPGCHLKTRRLSTSCELVLVGGKSCQDLSPSARIGSFALLAFAHQTLQAGSRVQRESGFGGNGCCGPCCYRSSLRQQPAFRYRWQFGPLHFSIKKSHLSSKISAISLSRVTRRAPLTLFSRIQRRRSINRFRLGSPWKTVSAEKLWFSAELSKAQASPPEAH